MLARETPASLGADYLAAIIARVNDYRWMAGLPGGVTLDPTENANAQQAALMMAANDELESLPAPRTGSTIRPPGADGAAHSDLTLGASGVTAIDLYMTDPGDGNTFVGHRRWVLYPPTQTMGVGDIPAESNALYVVQPQMHACALRNRGRVAAGWVRAGSTHSRSAGRFSPMPVPTSRMRRSPSPRTAWPRPSKSSVTTTDDYGGNAIVWDLPFAPAPQPGLQSVYTVNVGNVLINGVPQSFSYTTTSFDPSNTTALERCLPRSSSSNRQPRFRRTAARSTLKSLAA